MENQKSHHIASCINVFFESYCSLYRCLRIKIWSQNKYFCCWRWTYREIVISTIMICWPEFSLIKKYLWNISIKSKGVITSFELLCCQGWVKKFCKNNSIIQTSWLSCITKSLTSRRYKCWKNLIIFVSKKKKKKGYEKRFGQ